MYKAVQTEPDVKPNDPHAPLPASLLLSGRWLNKAQETVWIEALEEKQAQPEHGVSACPGRAGCVFVRPNQTLYSRYDVHKAF